MMMMITMMETASYADNHTVSLLVVLLLPERLIVVRLHWTAPLTMLTRPEVSPVHSGEPLICTRIQCDDTYVLL